jgi:hypothetical protein
LGVDPSGGGPTATNLSVAIKLGLWEDGYMKTTLDIPDPLFKQVKARAALDGLKLKDVVTDALSDYLKRPKQTGTPKPCPFPLVRGKGGRLLKRINNKTIAKLEEEADLERYRRSLGH